MKSVKILSNLIIDVISITYTYLFFNGKKEVESITYRLTKDCYYVRGENNLEKNDNKYIKLSVKNEKYYNDFVVIKDVDYYIDINKFPDYISVIYEDGIMIIPFIKNNLEDYRILNLKPLLKYYKKVNKYTYKKL